MSIELLIFFSFLSLSAVFHALEHRVEHLKDHAHGRHRVIALALTALSHPATIGGIHEFLVHVVVYSGNVIGAH